MRAFLSTAVAGVLSIASIAPAAAPAATTPVPSLFVLTCAGSSLTAAFRQAKGIAEAAKTPRKPGSIVLSTPASPALLSQLQGWANRPAPLNCALSQESADGQMIATWSLTRAVPGKLGVANANAGGRNLQTVTLPLTFASLAKA
jgi:hypothetical protein